MTATRKDRFFESECQYEKLIPLTGSTGAEMATFVGSMVWYKT